MIFDSLGSNIYFESGGIFAYAFNVNVVSHPRR